MNDINFAELISILVDTSIYAIINDKFGHTYWEFAISLVLN